MTSIAHRKGLTNVVSVLVLHFVFAVVILLESLLPTFTSRIHHVPYQFEVLYGRFLKQHRGSPRARALGKVECGKVGSFGGGGKLIQDPFTKDSFSKHDMAEVAVFPLACFLLSSDATALLQSRQHYLMVNMSSSARKSSHRIRYSPLHLTSDPCGS